MNNDPHFDKKLVVLLVLLFLAPILLLHEENNDVVKFLVTTEANLTGALIMLITGRSGANTRESDRKEKDNEATVNNHPTPATNGGEIVRQQSTAGGAGA